MQKSTQGVKVMNEAKKKPDKVTIITIAVVAILIITFVVGFIWGLNNVLAMEGTMPPSENVEGLTPAPETKEEAVNYLNTVLEKALDGKPKFASRSEFAVDEESVETDGSEQMKSTMLYLRESFEGYLGDNSEKNEADFSKGFDDYLRMPAISADDIEDFKCEYIYYKCASCEAESEEPLDKCDACGNDNPYNMMYRDEYTITLTLKNDEQIVKNNFEPKEGDSATAMLGDEVKETFDVNNVDVQYDLLTVTFRVNRLTDEVISLEYQKDMSIGADASFKGAYAKLGTHKASFKMVQKDIFEFTWPSLVLSEEKMTVEPKKGDNLLATLTCDDPVKYKVKWESSDESIVTVDEEGYFDAGQKTGEATITASFEFNGKTYSDSCKIYVRYSVESIKVSDKKLNLSVGDTHKLDVTVSPKKATVKTVKWYSENEKIATVDENGTITAVSSGTVKVYALSDDGYYKSTCEVRVK